MSGTPGRATIDCYAKEFAKHRAMAEGAARQLPFEVLRGAVGPEVNSVVVILKHMAGNLRSRWTEPFTSDGEKPWRDRDREFVDDFADADALWQWWGEGWRAIEGVLASATDADLPRELRIRNEPHTFMLALVRSLAHTAYHTGQVTQNCRVLAARNGVAWKTLTIPKGGSAAFNQRMGFSPERG